MADDKQLHILKQSVQFWNKWKTENENVRPDLNLADLSGLDLSKANLAGAYLIGANLTDTNLNKADMRESVLIEANFTEARLNGTHLNLASLVHANLRNATLCGAILRGADLSFAHLIGADLSGADLSKAILDRTNLSEAKLIGCQIYGVSAWDVDLAGTAQEDLIITRTPPHITTDSLEVAQFLYLMVNNKKLRNVIDTIGRKAVLILGRFTSERKEILNVLRSSLRKYGYVPILFDFEGPNSRNLTETIVILAHLARFIIADITDPMSIPHELQAIVPHLPSVPIQPILVQGESVYAMFKDIQRYPWVLPIFRYETQAMLMDRLSEEIIKPSEDLAAKLRRGNT